MTCGGQSKVIRAGMLEHIDKNRIFRHGVARITVEPRNQGKGSFIQGYPLFTGLFLFLPIMPNKG